MYFSYVYVVFWKTKLISVRAGHSRNICIPISESDSECIVMVNCTNSLASSLIVTH